MCDEVHSFHSMAKTTKQHQINKIGTQLQIIRKQALCSIHNKELDFICTHSSHTLQIVCILCVVSSHQTHPCTTAAEYFNGKQQEVRALLERVECIEGKLKQGVEAVGQENSAIAGNRESVATSINRYFTKVF
jgi:hypothetical protein